MMKTIELICLMKKLQRLDSQSSLRMKRYRFLKALGKLLKEKHKM
jgi:uncharacterized Rmd1/YagE family protein